MIIRQNAIDNAIRQSILLGKMGKRLAALIKFVEALAKATQPDQIRVRPIDINSQDSIVANAIPVTGITLVSNEFSGAKIEFAKAAPKGGDPEAALAIPGDEIHLVIAQTRGIIRVKFIMGKLSFRPIKFIQSAAKCRDPQISEFIFIDRPHLIGADACRIIRIVFIMNEFIVVSIEIIQAAAERPDPEPSPGVLE